MEDGFITEEGFVKVLQAIKFNRENDSNINIKKGFDIINLVRKNKKFNEFLISKFIEDYIKYVCTHKTVIEQNIANNYKSDLNNNGFYIKMSCDSFKNMATKITIDGKHLSDEEIEQAIESFKLLQSNNRLNNIISYKYIKDYVSYVYTNRYQIRKHLSKRINRLKKDKDGDYLIDDSYIVRDNNDGGKNSPFWISIEIDDNEELKGDITKDIVVKNMFKENEKETALIAEEIARELQLPVAQYYPAKYVGKKYKSKCKREFNDNIPYISDRIVITPNFLEEGEELITGDRIAGLEMDVSKVPNLIREYLKKENVSGEKIEKLISDYRLIMVYNCFINHRDCHNGNWGYIKNKDGDFKIAHIFDLEGSLCENIHHIRAIYVGDYMDDEHIYDELLQDDNVRKRANQFLYLNMRNVMNKVVVSKGVYVPFSKRNATYDLIENQKKVLEKAIIKIEKYKQEDMEK